MASNSPRECSDDSEINTETDIKLGARTIVQVVEVPGSWSIEDMCVSTHSLM